MDASDAQLAPFSVQTSLDDQITAKGEISLDVQASDDVVEVSRWGKWYEKESIGKVEVYAFSICIPIFLHGQVRRLMDKVCHSCIRPASIANRETQKIFDGMELTRDERNILKTLKTTDQLLDHVRSMAAQHQSDNNEQGFQQVMANIGSFAETYGCIVDALKQAPPFGAGHIAFGLFAVTITVSCF